MKALIIVDLQKDFLPGGALAIPRGDEIVPTINSLQSLFDCVVATKDWHPPEHISFAKRHHKKPGDVILVKGRRQELWPDHCVQHTAGSEFSPGLHEDAIEHVFFKGIDPEIDSYSTFFDNAHQHSTGLSDYLKKKGIQEIYFAGLATDYCVKFSVFDALELGFKAFVIIDACRGIDLNRGDVERAYREMQEKGAHLLTSRDLLKKKG